MRNCYFPLGGFVFGFSIRIAIPKCIRQDILFLAVKGKSNRLEFVAFYTVVEVLLLAIYLLSLPCVFNTFFFAV